jgi:hypothetical protein
MYHQPQNTSSTRDKSLVKAFNASVDQHNTVLEQNCTKS